MDLLCTDISCHSQKIFDLMVFLRKLYLQNLNLIDHHNHIHLFLVSYFHLHYQNLIKIDLTSL